MLQKGERALLVWKDVGPNGHHGQNARLHVVKEPSSDKECASVSQETVVHALVNQFSITFASLLNVSRV